MRILFINNQGAGFADYVEVAAHTTVQKLFEKQMPGCAPEDYLIRVNRQPAARDEALKEGDRVSFTPTKIEGAKCGSGAACRSSTIPSARTRSPDLSTACGRGA